MYLKKTTSEVMSSFSSKDLDKTVLNFFLNNESDKQLGLGKDKEHNKSLFRLMLLFVYS